MAEPSGRPGPILTPKPLHLGSSVSIAHRHALARLAIEGILPIRRSWTTVNLPRHGHSVPQTSILDCWEKRFHPGYLSRTAIRTGPWLREWLVQGCRAITATKGRF